PSPIRRARSPAATRSSSRRSKSQIESGSTRNAGYNARVFRYDDRRNQDSVRTRSRRRSDEAGARRAAHALLRLEGNDQGSLPRAEVAAARAEEGARRRDQSVQRSRAGAAERKARAGFGR